MSTGRATPPAGLEGLAGVTKQQPQPGTDEQILGNVAEGVHDKEKMTAAAAKGSTKRLSAGAGWKPRRGRKPSPPAADSPALEVQGGTAAECGTSGLEDKDASKLDEQVQATDHAQDQGKDSDDMVPSTASCAPAYPRWNCTAVAFVGWVSQLSAQEHMVVDQVATPAWTRDNPLHMYVHSTECALSFVALEGCLGRHAGQKHSSKGRSRWC